MFDKICNYLEENCHLLMSRAQAKERGEGVENPGEDTIKCEFNILLADLLLGLRQFLPIKEISC